MTEKVWGVLFHRHVIAYNDVSNESFCLSCLKPCCQGAHSFKEVTASEFTYDLYCGHCKGVLSLEERIKHYEYFIDEYGYWAPTFKHRVILERDRANGFLPNTWH